MRRSIGICAIFLMGALCAAAEQPAPLLVFLPGSGGQNALHVAGWEVAVVPHAAASDAGVLAIAEAVANAAKSRAVDPLRTYLAGEDEAVAAVFYAVSRRPDLWAAALAIGGSPRQAIATNRLFAANSSLVPLLWFRDPQDKSAAGLETKLRSAGFNLDPAPSSSITEEQAYVWLGEQKRYDFPPKVDCETGNPQFDRCYWAEIAKLDPAQRNSALEQSRIAPGSGAFLDLKGFGYKIDSPGPGVLVGWLPKNYSGPLKLEDRIVSIGGHELSGARAYVEYMAAVSEEKSTAIVIQRGGQSVRIETRILLTKREEVETARLRAEYSAESGELLVISRGVSLVRLRLPEQWTPCRINWNGTALGTADSAGCWSLGSGAPLRRCQ
jgi:hypothetical protein